MVTREKIMDQLDWLTDKLSTQVRTVALGVLALSWGLLVGESSAAKAVNDVHRNQLLFVGLLAVLVMFCDYLQYLAGYFNVYGVYREMSIKNAGETEYEENFFLLARKFLFRAKQWLLAGTVIWLGILVVRAIA